MLIIFYKSDGEIYRVVSPYKNMSEYFGPRADEYSLIFDSLYIDELSDYLFNRYTEFTVDVKTKTLRAKNNSFYELIGGGN